MSVIKNITKTAAIAGMLAMIGSAPALAGDHSMGFFVTSVGIGDGANLGGLAGADAHCAKLASAAGSEGRTWRAYLSTQVKGKRGVSARDRIGQGPGTMRRESGSPATSTICISVRTWSSARRWTKSVTASRVGVTSRTSMTFSPALRPMGPLISPGKRGTRLAPAGPATTRAAPRLAIMTAMAAAIPPGTRRTIRAGEARTI
jgi:hypothetical protein